MSVSVSSLGKALELAQLAAKLSEEARLWLEGVAEPKKAWRRLDERYGNKDLAVLSTMYRLKPLKLL